MGTNLSIGNINSSAFSDSEVAKRLFLMLGEGVFRLYVNSLTKEQVEELGEFFIEKLSLVPIESFDELSENEMVLYLEEYKFYLRFFTEYLVAIGNDRELLGPSVESLNDELLFDIDYNFLCYSDIWDYFVVFFDVLIYNLYVLFNTFNEVIITVSTPLLE